MSERTRAWVWTAITLIAATLGSARGSAAIPTGERSEGPDRPGPLVVVHATVAHEWTDRVDTLNWSYPGYLALRSAAAVFEDLAAFRAHEMDLGVGASRRSASVEFVTQTYLDVLDVRPILGRAFQPGEDAMPQRHPVVLLAHETWRRCFDGDPRIVGRTIELDGRAFTVVGVLPEGFRGLSGTAEIWVPLTMAPLAYPHGVWREPSTSWLGVVGRIRSGVTLDEAGVVVAQVASWIAEKLQTPSAAAASGGAALVPIESAAGRSRLRRAAWAL